MTDEKPPESQPPRRPRAASRYVRITDEQITREYDALANQRAIDGDGNDATRVDRDEPKLDPESGTRVDSDDDDEKVAAPKPFASDPTKPTVGLDAVKAGEDRPTFDLDISKIPETKLPDAIKVDSKLDPTRPTMDLNPARIASTIKVGPPVDASLSGEKAPGATQRFVDAMAELLRPHEIAPSGGAPALLDADPLSPPKINTRTKKLISKRLERSPLEALREARQGLPAIVVSDLNATYETQQILFGLSFTVHHGEILAILGGSGSGKTTLLKHLIGLIRPASGRIEIGGRDIAHLEGDDLAVVLKSIGMLFQYSALFNSMTVGENVALPLREYTDLPEGAIQAIVRLKLSLVGLPGIENKLPNELSGGMKKRVALARAVALDPDVLFFDEPLSGLDPIASAALDDLIRHLNRSFGTTMVIVTHDLENAFNVAHRILMIDRGKIAALGTPDEIKSSQDPWVKSFIARRAAARDAVDEGFFQRLSGVFK